MTSSPVSIVGGKLRVTGIARPTDAAILADVAAAAANGISLAGQGPYRRVAGVAVPVIVGPLGCTCVVSRGGDWCHHRSLYAVATGQVTSPEPPKPIKPTRRGWTRRTPKQEIPKPLITRLRRDDGRPTPFDRIRARNRALHRQLNR